MAMESTLFIGDFPIETTISSGFPIATFDYRRVSPFWLIASRDGWFWDIADTTPYIFNLL